MRNNTVIQPSANKASEVYKAYPYLRMHIVGLYHFLLTNYTRDGVPIFKKKFEQFLDLYASGLIIDSKNPVYMLREKLRREDEHLKPKDRTKLFVKAWNMFLQGDQSDTKLTLAGNNIVLQNERGYAIQDDITEQLKSVMF